jgi:hypothetical protein
MELVTVWLGLFVGFLGWLGTTLLAGLKQRGSPQDTGRKQTEWLPVLFVAVITIVFWAISMQTRPPFSTGQTLGMGFLIGGLAGAVAGWFGTRFAPSDSRRSRLAIMSGPFFALFALSLTFLIFRTDPHWALIGFSIGAAMAAIVNSLSRKPGTLSALYSEIWAGFGIAVSVGIVLAIHHFDLARLRIWWPLPIYEAVSVLVASYIGTEIGFLGSENGKQRVVPSIIASALIVIGLSAVYSWGIVKTWQMFDVAAAGTLIGIVLIWIASASRENRSSRMNAAALTLLLAVAFFVATFKVFSGLGIAIGLIAAWSIALPVLAPEIDEAMRVSRPIAGSLSLLLVLLLFRLFVDRYSGDLRFADLQIHYTFIGALLGIILPFFAISALARLENATLVRKLAGIGAIGLIAAACPILLFVIWQIKAVLGLAFGLAACSSFLLFLRLAGEEKAMLPGEYSIAPLVIGAELVAIQFISPLMELDLTRAARIHVLFCALAALVVWIVIDGIFAARKQNTQGG